MRGVASHNRVRVWEGGFRGEGCRRLMPGIEMRHRRGGAQSNAKCRFAGAFDRLPEQLCRLLDRLPGHLASHWEGHPSRGPRQKGGAHLSFLQKVQAHGRRRLVPANSRILRFLWLRVAAARLARACRHGEHAQSAQA